MTIADSLALLHSTKTAIKAAIEDKGVIVGAAPFADYPDKIAEISGGGGSVPLEWSQEYYDAVFAAGPGSWSRPEWRPIQAVSPTEQKFVALHAVYPEGGNFCAISAGGAYTVDWGDGVVENFTSGVTAQHIFDYANPLLNGTDAPVTLTGATSVVNRAAHGFTDGKKVTLWNLSGATGLAQGQDYYVINAATDSFQLAATPGGIALAFAGDGTATLTQYKQAIVTLTPQVGQVLSALNLNVRHSQTTAVYNTGWLDVTFGSPNFTPTGLVFSQSSGSSVVHKRSIERLRVASIGSAVSTLSYRFAGLAALQVITMPSAMWQVTDMSWAFTGCSSLLVAPALHTPNVTNMSGMFSSCSNLQTVPLFNTTNVTSMSSMFSSCYNLQTVPLFNTAKVTTMGSMFNGNYSLQTVPLFDTPNVTSMSSMFSGCSNLQSVPLFNTAKVTNMSGMFQSCYNLQTVPLFDTPNVTDMSSMFINCPTLQSVPLFNTAKVTSMSSMFSGCSNLQTVPLFNTAKVTTMGTMFNGNYSLRAVPALVTTAVTSSSGFSNMFSGCSSLARVEAKDFRFTFSVASCNLSATALDEIYTNLPTVTGQTITVTGNYGAAGDTPSIATAKGWTVTG